MKCGASFSECRKYRYTLWRSWDIGPTLNFIMLNPSTADETKDDPTITRCIVRATKLGFGTLIVTNLFALRATDPAELRKTLYPVGDGNDDAIKESASQSSMVICAWGNHGILDGRAAKVLKMLREFCPDKLRALKLTGANQPAHPLYLGFRLEPVPF